MYNVSNLNRDGPVSRYGTSPGDIRRDDAQFLPYCSVHQFTQRLSVEWVNVAIHQLCWWREKKYTYKLISYPKTQMLKSIRLGVIIPSLCLTEEVISCRRAALLVRLLGEDVVEVDSIGVLVGKTKIIQLICTDRL